MTDIRAWLAANPPPTTLEIGGATAADAGPYRAATGPLVIRHVGSRALVVAPLSVGVQTWIRRARWTGAGTSSVGLVVLLAGLGAGAAGAIQVGFVAFAIGIFAFVFSFFDEREPTVAPPTCQLALDRQVVRVSGALRLEVPLRDIRDLEQHPSGELRVNRPRARGRAWPALWIGPAGERAWIEQLLRAAIALDRAAADTAG
ncbi:MAG: hypothetical protein K8W52_31845 [Deltaproteobacteria bacterium]|nr:hypothetical protein [Deltaproteobacteria bacterium]